MSLFLRHLYEIHYPFPVTTESTVCPAHPSTPHLNKIWLMGLRPLVCWVCGLEYRQQHGCPFFVKCGELSGGGLFDGLITRPEESYQLRVCLIKCHQIQKEPFTLVMIKYKEVRMRKYDIWLSFTLHKVRYITFISSSVTFSLYIYIYIYIYRVSREECARLQENIP